MYFKEVAEYFDSIEGISSRLAMTKLLTELFSKVNKKEIKHLIYLIQGKLGPNYNKEELGLGEKLVIQAIAKATGHSKEKIENDFKKKGDLGLVAEEFIEKKVQQSLIQKNLTIESVFGSLLKIARSSGKGSQELKLKYLAELFNSSSPKEAKYFARIPLEAMRLGIADSTIMDALAQLFLEQALKDKNIIRKVEKQLKEKKEEKRKQELKRRTGYYIKELIEKKYNIHSDLGEIAEKLFEKGLQGLKEIKIEPGIPIRPALAERMSSAEEIIKKLGECVVEHKYDGFRLVIHKKENNIMLFSRNQENMTEMFPDLIKAVKKQVKVREIIFEGEAIAFDPETKEFHPFQVTIQRKRKYGVKEKAKKMPLKLFVFDLLYLNGNSWIEKPFKERKKRLARIIKKGKTIKLAQSIKTNSVEKLNKYFHESIASGLEGIIAKDLNAKYVTGARKFAWIKLKRSYKSKLIDTVDAIVIGLLKGKGHRIKFAFGALLVGVYDKKNNKIKSIAKIGTGFTEENLRELGELFTKEITKEKPKNVISELKPDKWINPKYVVEILADEITKSPIHTCAKEKGEGLALRFPRFIRLREKSIEDATTEKEIIKLFKAQKHITKEGI